MPIIQLFFSTVLLILFLWLVFLLSWYVALPLLLIFVVIGAFRWLYLKVLQYRYQRAANGCTIRQDHSTKPQPTIIDVDYTEIS